MIEISFSGKMEQLSRFLCTQQERDKMLEAQTGPQAVSCPSSKHGETVSFSHIEGGEGMLHTSLIKVVPKHTKQSVRFEELDWTKEEEKSKKRFAARKERRFRPRRKELREKNENMSSTDETIRLIREWFNPNQDDLSANHLQVCYDTIQRDFDNMLPTSTEMTLEEKKEELVHALSSNFDELVQNRVVALLINVLTEVARQQRDDTSNNNVQVEGLHGTFIEEIEEA